MSTASGALPSALKQSGEVRRRTRIDESKPPTATVTTTTRSVDTRPNGRPSSIDYVEESNSNDEATPKQMRRSRLPTPPPHKNVSFGEAPAREQTTYIEQSILPPPVQFVPKHRHTGMLSLRLKNAEAHLF